MSPRSTSLFSIVDTVASVAQLTVGCSRVRAFIGQGAGGSGKGAKSDGAGLIKGMTQKEQKEVLDQFRGGHFNTLVATCIGEEGLDIIQACQSPQLLI